MLNIKKVLYLLYDSFIWRLYEILEDNSQMHFYLLTETEEEYIDDYRIDFFKGLSGIPQNEYTEDGYEAALAINKTLEKFESN